MSKPRPPLIVLPPGAHQQLVAEEEDRSSKYLDEMTKIQMCHNQAMNNVLVSALSAKGLPLPGHEAVFVEHCKAVAKLVSDHQLKEKFTAMSALIDEIKPKALSPELIWAAAQCGVTLALPEGGGETTDAAPAPTA